MTFMRKYLLLLVFLSVWIQGNVMANEPETGYLFSYNQNGIRFAWSVDRVNWHMIGENFCFLSSDYGSWMGQKRMIDPIIVPNLTGGWHCLFTVNEEEGTIAYTTSPDLIHWEPQSYPHVAEKGNCMLLELTRNADNDYLVTWIDTKSGGNQVYGSITKDFKTYTSARKMSVSVRENRRETILVNGMERLGVVNKVPWNVIDQLIKYCEYTTFREMQFDETMMEDTVRFASLLPVDATVTIHPERKKRISDMLIGIFFEDINYSADGGLYAELIQNRDFEYKLSDKLGSDETWNSKKAWSLRGERALFTVDSVLSLHENNPHYAVLELKTPGAALINEGYDGIVLQKGDEYYFSMFSRLLQGKGGDVIIRLIDENGNICGEQSMKISSEQWKKKEIVLQASHDAQKASLEIVPQFTGCMALDMVSLFPKDTFKGRRNGLRKDLAQTLANIRPRFIRFPGGCVAHGDGLDNMYRWKNTIGPLEARKPQRNLWGYHQSVGLGYYEYFQFCEDIGAEPLPVLPAGVPCQNSATGGQGQQGGIPMDEMQAYVQEVLDLIEWANGDAEETYWGRKRAEAGHPAPFNLKYIGIGNEDLISDVFEERYTMICKAVMERYPNITVIGTVGPFFKGSDYEKGWSIAKDIKLPMVDEHYYCKPGWFIHNQNYYDRYDRSQSKVYLGEYAAHVPGRKSNLEAALCEALHLANIERNGDVVSFTSYAPLLGKEGHIQWAPDLIYFNNTEVKLTPSYHVQQLFGQNGGNEYWPNLINLSNKREDVRKRIAISVVKNTDTGEYVIKLVNLLPVDVNFTIDLSPLNIVDTHIKKTILHGNPNDSELYPNTSEFTITEKLKESVPGYSLVVLRMK